MGVSRMTYKDQCKYYEKEIEELNQKYEKQKEINKDYVDEVEQLTKQIEHMQESVREVLANENTEVGQILRAVDLVWVDKNKIKMLEDRITELEAENLSLRCCGNCGHYQTELEPLYCELKPEDCKDKAQWRKRNG